MIVRASWLLHSSVRQLGHPAEFIAVDDLLLNRHSGRLCALMTAQGLLPIEQVIMGWGGNLLTIQPLDDCMDTNMPEVLERYVAARFILGQKMYRYHQLIGSVGDLQFDQNDGRLLAIEISQGLLPDLWYGRYHLTARCESSDEMMADRPSASEGVE